jgi:thiosulfate/3-mercaptopyruvate sulfurtransferase
MESNRKTGIEVKPMLQRSLRSFAATVALLAACSAPDTETPANDLLIDAPFTGDEYANPRALVDTEWVRAHLDDPAVHLIDVSPRRTTYDAGHLPGARFVQWDTDLTDAGAAVEGMILTGESLSALMSRLGVGNGHTVVFYDNARNLFAARGYWVLKYYGHDDVRVYDGGSRKWVADGQELTTVVTEPAPARYVAGEPDLTIATDWQYVVAGLGDGNALLCDTRSADEHTGVDVRAERGGHIPGAVNIEWTRNVRDDGTFLDARSLSDLYRAAGFTPDREIITYCQAGVRGAHTWFVLTELLGYPRVRNYDGSWAEYGNRNDSPIG